MVVLPSFGQVLGGGGVVDLFRMEGDVGLDCVRDRTRAVTGSYVLCALAWGASAFGENHPMLTAVCVCVYYVMWLLT